jgi:hypothetical protein
LAGYYKKYAVKRLPLVLEKGAAFFAADIWLLFMGQKCTLAVHSVRTGCRSEGRFLYSKIRKTKREKIG